MRVKVIIESYSDTKLQDEFLKAALERLAWGKEQEGDRLLVLQTFKARALPSNLRVELL